MPGTLARKKRLYDFPFLGCQPIEFINLLVYLGIGPLDFLEKLISHFSTFMTLHPGDVGWTGTPKGGSCPVKVGDVIEVETEGIGVLKNKVVAVR